jgi:hypothetical protein
VAAASGDSGYYVVTAVDAGGTESVQSLAVKPAEMVSGGDGGDGGGAGCFIGAVSNTMPENVWWLVVVLTVFLAIEKGVRCRVSGEKIRTE